MSVTVQMDCLNPKDKIRPWGCQTKNSDIACEILLLKKLSKQIYNDWHFVPLIFFIHLFNYVITKWKT